MKKRNVSLLSLLLERELVGDEKEALGLILAGKVIVNGQRIDKSGIKVSADCDIRLRLQRFVSRGGEKLYGALHNLNLEAQLQDQIILDIGSSTGGFCDASLKLKAKQVVCVDIGSNQLAFKLRQDPRVICFENTDIRNWHKGNYQFAWILADISFASLASLAQVIVSFGSVDTRFFLLLKPQFELPSFVVPQGGVVCEPLQWEEAKNLASRALQAAGLKILDIVESPLRGRRGNVEFFLYGQKM